MKKNSTQFYIYLNQEEEATLVDLNKLFDEVDNSLKCIFDESDDFFEPSEKSIENILKFANSTF